MVVESDEDVLLYETGHIPGAVKIDWHTDLNDPVTRDYVDGERLRGAAGLARASAATRPSSSTATRTTGGRRTRSGCSRCSATRTSGCSTAAARSGSPRAASITTDVPTPGAGRLPGRRARRPPLRAFQDDVLAHLGKPIVDVRSPEEYTGERTHMPDYPQEGALRGGHIPRRAACRGRAPPPTDGTFKPRDELEAIYQQEQRPDGRRRRHRLLPHRRAVEPHLVRAHVPARLRRTCATTTARGPSGATSVRVPIVKGEEPGDACAQPAGRSGAGGDVLAAPRPGAARIRDDFLAARAAGPAAAAARLLPRAARAAGAVRRAPRLLERVRSASRPCFVVLGGRRRRDRARLRVRAAGGPDDAGFAAILAEGLERADAPTRCSRVPDDYLFTTRARPRRSARCGCGAWRGCSGGPSARCGSRSAHSLVAMTMHVGCMVMHMTFTVAVAGASGYAGGEMLRLLLDHPEAEIGTVTAHSNAGTRLGEHQPHLRRLADRVLAPTDAEHLAGHDVVVLALPHGASGAVAAELGRRGARGRLRRRPPARRPRRVGGVLRRPPRRHLAVRAARAAARGGADAAAQRAALAGARRIAVPGCNVTAVTLGLQPGVAAGAGRADRRRRGPRQRLLGRRASRSRRTCSRARPSARRSRTRSAARTGTSPRSSRTSASPARATSRVSFTPTLVPMARGILATATARLVARRRPGGGPRRLGGRVRGRAVRAPAARGPVADDGRDARREHRARPGRRRRARRPRRDRHRDRQPRQGHRRRRRAVPQPRARPARDARPARWTESRREQHRRPPTSPGVTAAAGFRAAGVTAGLKASGQPGRRARRQRRPVAGRGRGVHVATASSAAPVVWSRQAVSDGVASAVVLNSGGANVCTGPEGFEDTHATAEHVAEVLGVSSGDVLVVLDRPHRRAAPDARSCSRASSAAAAALSADGGPDAAVAIMTTDTVPKTAHVRRDAVGRLDGRRHGQGRRACSPPALATMLCVLTTDADVDAADRRRRAARRDRHDVRPHRLRRLHVHQRHRGAARLRARAACTPDPAELRRGRHARCARDLARALVADAEGATHDIAVTVVDAETEDAAVAVARAVTRSNLFKAAIFGNDPNWGRILAAGRAPSPSRSRPSTRRSSTSPSTASRCAARGGADEDRSKRRPRRAARGARRDRPARRRRVRDGLDQRPHARLRPREQRVLHMSDRPTPDA